MQAGSVTAFNCSNNHSKKTVFTRKRVEIYKSAPLIWDELTHCISAGAGWTSEYMSVVHLFYLFIHYNLCESLDEILAQQSVSTRASARSRMSCFPNVVEQRSGTLEHSKAEWEDAGFFFVFFFLKERHQREEGQTEEEWKVCIASGWGCKNQSITRTMIETIKTRQLSCEIKSVKHFQSSRFCWHICICTINTELWSAFQRLWGKKYSYFFY